MIQNILKYHPFWYPMYKLFGIRRPIPNDFLSFDEIICMSDFAKQKNTMI